MPRNGDTQVDFNEGFFANALRQPQVVRLVDAAAARALAAAKSTAPVATGNYQRSIHIEHHESRYRQTARVVAEDPKSMLIESQTGNLARALRAAKAS